MPSALTATFEGTNYATTVPFATPLPWLYGGSVIALVACIVVTRRARYLLPIAAAFAAALGALLAYGVGSSGYLTMGGMFPTAYSDLALAGACAGACVGSAATALSIAARTAERPSRVALSVMLAALAFSLVTAAGTVLRRRALGPRDTRLPFIIATGRWRGHAGFTHDVKASFAVPSWTGFFGGTLTPVEVVDADARGWDWICDDCVTSVHPESRGPAGVVIHGHVGRVQLERRLEFTALAELGNAQWPLQVGEHRVLAIQSSRGSTTGGWAAALADGAHSLVPHELGPPKVKSHAAEVRVLRTEMRDGLRRWVIELTMPDEQPSTIEVYALDGQTWVEREHGDPIPFIEDHGVVESGAYYCKIVGLPFTVCNAGNDDHFPLRGPIAGSISGDSGAQSVLVTLLTLGAVAPGSGPEQHYCFESGEVGTGETMPVGELPKGRPRDVAVSNYASCASVSHARHKPTDAR
jgi:hypothetical protein